VAGRIEIEKQLEPVFRPWQLPAKEVSAGLQFALIEVAVIRRFRAKVFHGDQRLAQPNDVKGSRILTLPAN